MRSALWLLLLAFMVLKLCGCAEKRSTQYPVLGTQKKAQINIILAPECLTKPVVLVNCNSDVPPKCKSVNVAFKKDCGVVEVKQK